MQPLSPPAAFDRCPPAAAPLPASSDSFTDRARQLVAFLAEAAPASSSPRREETELSAWIVGWQQALSPGPGRRQHFMAEELGIIVRALSGPVAGNARMQAAQTERLRWVIARSMVASV